LEQNAPQVLKSILLLGYLTQIQPWLLAYHLLSYFTLLDGKLHKLLDGQIPLEEASSMGLSRD